MLRTGELEAMFVWKGRFLSASLPQGKEEVWNEQTRTLSGTAVEQCETLRNIKAWSLIGNLKQKIEKGRGKQRPANCKVSLQHTFSFFFFFFREVYLTYIREYIKWWFAQKFASKQSKSIIGFCNSLIWRKVWFKKKKSNKKYIELLTLELSDIFLLPPLHTVLFYMGLTHASSASWYRV